MAEARAQTVNIDPMDRSTLPLIMRRLVPIAIMPRKETWKATALKFAWLM
jgi:hypothetical protein